MIRKSDLFINYLIFFLISLVGILPIRFEMKTGQVKVFIRGWRRWIWRFWKVQAFAYCLYMNIRLIQSTVLGHYVEFHHLAFHIGMSGFSITMNVWSKLFFSDYPDIVEAVFNSLNLCDATNKAKRLKYTGNEVLIMNLPSAAFLNTAGCFAGLYIYDRRSLEYLYSAMPSRLQNNYTFVLLLLYETSIMYYYLSVAYFGVFTQQGFIQYCNTHLDESIKILMSKKFRTNWSSMIRLCKKETVMELNLRLFNKVYAYGIFFWKIYLITASVNYWFFGIRGLRNGTETLLLVMYMFLAFFHVALFIIMYDKAFCIPERLLQVKNLSTFKAQSLAVQEQKEYVIRKMKAITNLGIKVGDFAYFERISTPSYVDFVTSQVVSLLIAFP